MDSFAADAKGWYGLHFVGFGGNDGEDAGLFQQEYQPPYGFAARPVDASGSGSSRVGCNGFFSLDGDFAWLGHDPRYSDKCPTLEEGDVALWNKLGAHVHLDAKNDKIVVTHHGGAVVEITAAKVTVTGATVEIGSGAVTVALSTKTDQELTAIYTWASTHTHGTGVGPSSPPIQPPTQPQSVACQKLLTE